MIADEEQQYDFTNLYDPQTGLLLTKESLDERIDRSLVRIERGEGLNEEQLRAFLAERRASRNA